MKILSIYVDVPVVNIEYSLGRGQTNMAAEIFKKLPLTWLKVTRQQERPHQRCHTSKTPDRRFRQKRAFLTVDFMV
jgi:hypothetical protein